ncbi:hypothetical protein T08_9499 [Trichinella sp. T8]|nr:hypothetical protein T08_9499 [Trichinella sp. T8]
MEKMRPGMAPVFKAADWLGTSFGHVKPSIAIGNHFHSTHLGRIPKPPIYHYTANFEKLLLLLLLFLLTITAAISTSLPSKLSISVILRHFLPSTLF